MTLTETLRVLLWEWGSYAAGSAWVLSSALQRWTGLGGLWHLEDLLPALVSNLGAWTSGSKKS